MRWPSAMPARSQVRREHRLLGLGQRRRFPPATERSCTSGAARGRARRTRPAPRSAAALAARVCERDRAAPQRLDPVRVGPAAPRRRLAPLPRPLRDQPPDPAAGAPARGGRRARRERRGSRRVLAPGARAGCSAGRARTASLPGRVRTSCRSPSATVRRAPRRRRGRSPRCARSARRSRARRTRRAGRETPRARGRACARSGCRCPRARWTRAARAAASRESRGERGEQAAGEDVASGSSRRARVAVEAVVGDRDRLQGGAAVRARAAVARREEGRPVLAADRLEHLDRDDLVEAPVDVAVVLRDGSRCGPRGPPRDTRPRASACCAGEIVIR